MKSIVTRKKGISFGRAMARLQGRAATALEEAGTVLLQESLKIVPRDTETLALSGFVRYSTTTTPYRSEIRVGYGTEGFMQEAWSKRLNAMVLRHPFEYAVLIHEDLDMPHDAGQTALYLKTPRDDAGVQAAMVAVFNAEMWRR